MMRREDTFLMSKKLDFKNAAINNQKIMSVQYNAETKKTDLVMYGVIGPEEWENAISVKDVEHSLKSAKGDLVVYVNSPGGDTQEGISIYERLMNYKKTKKSSIEVIVNGHACSAASVITMAGDKMIMGLGSLLKLTNAYSVIVGTKQDIRKAAVELDKLDQQVVDIYMTKGKISRSELVQMMEDETWINAEKALDIGFVTESQNNPNRSGSNE